MMRMYLLLVSCVIHREGINWADIEWVDNAECLDLIERVSPCNLFLVQHLLPGVCCVCTETGCAGPPG